MFTTLGIESTLACLILAILPFILYLKNRRVQLAIFLLATVLMIAIESYCGIGVSVMLIAFLFKLRLRYMFVLLSVSTLILTTFNWESLFGRLFIWYTSLNHISEYWLTGLGFETFSYHYAHWQADAFQKGEIPNFLCTIVDSPNYALNELLHFWIELGIAIPIIFGFVIYVYALHIVRFHKRQSFPIVLSNAVIMVFSLFSYVFHNYWIIALFFVNFLVLGVSHFPNARLIFLLIVFSAGIPATFYFLKFKRAVSLWEEAILIPTDVEYKNTLLKTSFVTLKKNNNFLSDYYHFLQENIPDSAILFLQNNGRYMNGYERTLYLGDAYNSTGNIQLAKKYYESAHYIVPSRFLPLLRMLEIYGLTGDRDNELFIARLILNMPVKVQTTVSIAARKSATEVLDGIKSEIKMY